MGTIISLPFRSVGDCLSYSTISNHPHFKSSAGYMLERLFYAWCFGMLEHRQRSCRRHHLRLDDVTVYLMEITLECIITGIKSIDITPEILFAFTLLCPLLPPPDISALHIFIRKGELPGAGLFSWLAGVSCVIRYPPSYAIVQSRRHSRRGHKPGKDKSRACDTVLLDSSIEVVPLRGTTVITCRSR